MKKRMVLALLLTMALLGSLAGCGTAPQKPGIPTGESTTTTTTQPEESHELLSLAVVEKVPEGAVVCMDTLVAAYNDSLKLTANQDLRTVRFTTVDPDSLKLDETLYVLPSLTQGESLYICTYVNDAIPNRGIACTDQTGITHEYHITDSGKDGSVGLTRIEKPVNTEPIPVELMTADEQAEMQDFLNEMSNNGLVGYLNLYDAPQNVSLREMFYQGIGAEEVDWQEGEVEALLRAAGWEELYTSVTKVPAMGVEQLVLDKLGLTLDEMATTMEQEGFVYLSEYDAYYHMHGDTNYAPVTVVDGSKDADGRYYVQYHMDSFPGEVYKVTLRKTENGYQFVSNTRV